MPKPVVFSLGVGFKAGNPWMGQERSVENTFPLQRPRSEEPEWTVADKNHDAILLIPDILERLVMLLTFDKVPFGREVRKLNCCQLVAPGNRRPNSVCIFVILELSLISSAMNF